MKLNNLQPNLEDGDSVNDEYSASKTKNLIQGYKKTIPFKT